MASRIGIKVNVDFPSVTEIQGALNDKLKKVKEKPFKINIDADGNSLKSLRSKIQKSLNENKFDVKLDTDTALKNIATLKQKLNDVDTKLKKKRTLKVDLDIVNLDKKLSDVIKAMSDNTKKATKQANDGIKEYTKSLKGAMQDADKITRQQTSKNGVPTSNKTTTTKVNPDGTVSTKTTRNDRTGRTDTVAESYDKEKALNRIKDRIKEIHNLEMKMSKAKADKDSNSYDKLEQRHKQLVQSSEQLARNFKDVTGKSHVNNDGVKALKEQLAHEKQLLSAKQKTTKEAQKQKKEAKEQSDARKAVADNVKKLIGYENQVNEIQKKLVTASGQYKQSLVEQVNHKQRQISQLEQENNLWNKMNNNQRKAVGEQRKLNALSLQAVEAREKDKVATQRQSQAQNEVVEQLKRVLSLKQKIKTINSNPEKDGDTTRLRILQEELNTERQKYRQIRDNVKEQGLMTKELSTTLSTMRKMNAEQKRVISNTGKMNAEQDRANKTYNDAVKSLQRIGQLQRDLIFSGQREREVIEDAIQRERDKLQVLKQEIQASQLITAERKNEIQQIERAQAEQRKLNQLRQSARETDQEFNYVGGVADFRTVAMNYYQGFQTVLREVKEVDEAFMRIKKVAESSDQALAVFRKQSFDTASELGVTATEYMSAVEKWVTAGYTLSKSENLAQISTIGSFVGNIDADLMAKWLSVPLNAFSSSGIEANDVINVMNETANNHAIEMEELGKAYMRSASSMTNVGTTFQELTGFITGAQEATRAGGERIGTSFKAISSNYASIKGQLTEQQQIKHDWFETNLGISLEDTESMTEAFSKLANVWDGLSQTERNTAAFFFAGKEHQNTLTAMLNEWDTTVMPAINDAQNQMGRDESGSAYKEFAEQKDSVRFALAEVKNAWSELMDTIGNSDGFVKDILDATTKSLQAINDIVQDEQLMEVLKLILVGVGMSAMANGTLRVLDLMGASLLNVKKHADDSWGALYRMSKLKFQSAMGLNGDDDSNGRGNGRNGNNGGNGGNGGVILAGGRRDSDNGTGNNRNRARGRRGRNNSDDGDNGSTAIIAGRNSLRQSGEDLSRTSQNMARGFGVATKFAKGFIGTLPVVGQALLAMELLGFDTIGTVTKLFNALTDSAVKNVEESTKKIKELYEENELLNGDVEARQNTLDSANSRRDKYSDGEETIEGKANPNYGFLEAEKFNQIAEQYNNLAEELDLDVDVRITRNNPEMIEKVVRAVEEAQDENAKKEAKEAIVGLNSALKEQDTFLRESAKDLKSTKEYLEDSRIEMDKSFNEGKKKYGDSWEVAKNGSSVEAESYQRAKESFEKHKKEYNELKKVSDEVEKGVTENMDSIVKAILTLGGKSVDVMADVDDLGSAQLIFENVAKGAKDMQKEMDTISPIFEKVKNGTELTKTEFLQLQESMQDVQALSEGGLAVKDWDYSTYLSDLKLQLEGNNGELSTLTENFQKTKLEAYNTGQSALEGAYMMLRGLGMSKEGVTNLLVEAGLLKTKLDEVTKERVLTVDSQDLVQTYEDAHLANEELRNMPKNQSVLFKVKQDPQFNTEVLKQNLDAVPKTKSVVFKAQTDTSYNSLLNSIKAPLFQRVIVQKQEERVSKERTVPKPSIPANKSIYNESVATRGLVSASVATGGGIVSNAVSSKSKGTPKPNPSPKPNGGESTNANATVSQDVWRHWRTQDKLDKLTNTMADLERSITLAGEDYAKIAQIYKKQLDVYSQQRSTLQTHKSAKVYEAQQRLGQLQAYGFNVNKKDLSISNLESQSMKLRGDSASKAEEVLNQWHSLVSEIGSIDQQIKDIESSVYNVKKAIEENNVQKELGNYKKFLEGIDKLLQSIQKKTELNDTFSSLIDGTDYNLQLMITEKMANDSANAITGLVDKFNRLARSHVANKGTGEELKTTLESLKTEILSNADSIIEYRRKLNDLNIERVTSDISKLREEMGRLGEDFENNRANVQEGLLSGTTLEDLQQTASKLSLEKQSQAERDVQERIRLEKGLQEALDKYSIRNIERTKAVAKETIQIQADMYNELINITSNYNNGVKSDGGNYQIKSQFLDIIEAIVKDTEYTFDSSLEKMFNEIYDKQVALQSKFAERLSSDVYEERLVAEYEYSVESLELQRVMLEKSIEISKGAIKEYQKQLENQDLTKTQRDELLSLIDDEEKAIVDSQNAIKESVAQLYEYKFQKIDELINKYDEMNSVLEYAKGLVDTLSPNDYNSQMALMQSMMDNETDRKHSVKEIIKSLEHEMGLVEKGSYEWNTINSELSEYNGYLRESNQTLASMIQQIAELTLNNVTGKFEKKLFDGKTQKQYNNFKELWITGLEREIKLEELYDKIAEIGTRQFDEKLALLEKQEKISSYEMDYLEKQMQIVELQQQLENKKEKTVKTLTRNSDGTFAYTYVADIDEEDSTASQIRQLQLELMELEDSAKESYLSKLQDIVGEIQSGNYDSKEQLKNDLASLSESYSMVLKDIPASVAVMTGDIVTAYEEMQKGNNQLLEELSNSANATPTVNTINKLESSIVTEIQKLGDKIKNAIEGANLSNGVKTIGGISSNSISSNNSNSSSFVIEKIEFPNVTSSDEIKDAILNLPKYAMQYAKQK